MVDQVQLPKTFMETVRFETQLVSFFLPRHARSQSQFFNTIIQTLRECVAVQARVAKTTSSKAATLSSSSLPCLYSGCKFCVVRGRVASEAVKFKAMMREIYLAIMTWVYKQQKKQPSSRAALQYLPAAFMRIVDATQYDTKLGVPAFPQHPSESFSLFYKGQHVKDRSVASVGNLSSCDIRLADMNSTSRIQMFIGRLATMNAVVLVHVGGKHYLRVKSNCKDCKQQSTPDPITVLHYYDGRHRDGVFDLEIVVACTSGVLVRSTPVRLVLASPKATSTINTTTKWTRSRSL